MRLTKEQYKLLKQIAHNESISLDALSKQDEEIVFYLEKQGYIEILSAYTENFFQVVNSAQITEAGKAYIEERKHEFAKTVLQNCFWPITVSVIANILIDGIRLLLRLLTQ